MENTQTSTEQGLVKPPPTGNLANINNSGFADDTFDISQLSAEQQLELAQDLMRIDAEIEAISYPMLNSKPLIGSLFNLLDANFKEMPPEKEGDSPSISVNFTCEFVNDWKYSVSPDEESTVYQSGQKFTVLKSSNAFNDIYVNFFNKWRGIANRQLNGYTFKSEPKYTKRNNPAVILVKAQHVKQVASAKSK